MKARSLIHNNWVAKILIFKNIFEGCLIPLLLHDVVARLKINDVTILQDIVRYIMANVGSLLSPNKIAKSLVSAGRKIDNKTVERYLQGLQDSLLLYKVNRYDVRGKELLRINAKYYSVDATLRNLIVGSTGRDTVYPRRMSSRKTIFSNI